MTLPPHFWVWVLVMATGGHADHLEGFRTETLCERAAAELNHTANRGVKFRCERFPILTG